MVHNSLMASIKMGVSPTNPKQQAAIPFFGHTKMLHMQWVALLLRLLLSYPGMVAWITRVWLMKTEKEKMSRCINLYNARVQILNKSDSFTTKCMMATERVTENVWLTPALMDDVME